jgi:hypothetical protein
MFYGTRKTIKIYQAHQKGHKNNSSLLFFILKSGEKERKIEMDHYSKAVGEEAHNVGCNISNVIISDATESLCR